MNRQRHRSRRSGWMLVEMIVIVTITGIAAGITSYLVVQLLRSSQNQTDSLVQARTLHLWAEQFRLDSRSAIHVQIRPEQSGIDLELPGSRVSYMAIDHGLERRLDQKLAGRWTTTGTWKFSFQEQTRIVRAELSSSEVRTQSAGTKSRDRDLPRTLRYRLEAALGRTP